MLTRMLVGTDVETHAYGVWSVKGGVWSVECRARNATRLKCCACHTKWRQRSPKRCACHENCNSSCENDAKVLRLPHTKRLSTRYKTRLNVTKWCACHAKRHYNLLWHLREGKVLQLSPQTRRGHRKTRDSRRDTWEHQNEHFVPDFLQFSHFVASKSMFS